MKGFFALRFGLITVASVLILFTLPTVNLWLRLPFAQLQTSTWLLISVVWVAGSAIVKWQFEKLGTPNQKKNPGEKTILEQANGPTGEEHDSPGPVEPSEARETTQRKTSMGKIVEGIVGSSLAEAELSLTLEVPEGQEIEVYGQKYKVTQGQVKIKPRKTKSKKLKDMFEKHKTKTRTA